MSRGASGFTAGATLTPRDGTVLGIGYRSSVHHEIDGSIGVPLVALAPLAGQVRAKLNTPDKLSVGLTQAVSPVARVNLGFEWDNWSRLGTDRHRVEDDRPAGEFPAAQLQGRASPTRSAPSTTRRRT